VINSIFSRYFFALVFFLYSVVLSAATEQVSIQLKWQHGFQFAGYYAAIEKGYYRDVGLEVSLKEIDFSKDFVEQVLNSESEYGISDSTLLIYHLQGKPVVLLKQFFQHSPFVFLSRRESGIVSPYEMVGKRTAFNSNNQGDAALNALILNTLGDLSKIIEVPPGSPYYQDFIDNKTDVVSAYSTSQPYLFKELGIEVNIINPQNYGIDFYGDNFFTSLTELEKHPERVEKISQATVKGWQYALDNTDEIITLIRTKYAPALSEPYLQYEARTTRQMIIPELVNLGTVDPKRYQQTAEDYQRLGFVSNSQTKKHFFYKLENEKPPFIPLTIEEKAWLKQHPKIAVGGGPDWAPFDFVNNNGQYSGIANDYLNLIAEKTGLVFEVSIDNWSNNLQKIRQNEIDLLGAAFFVKDRTKYVNYSIPYFEVLDYFFIRDDLQVKSIEDLNGKRVAIPKNYAHGEILKEHFPDIIIVTVATFGDAIDAVLENRADMLYDTYAALKYVLKKEGISSIIPFKSTRKLGNSPIHIITRKDAPFLASIIQKGLEAISENEKQTIYNKWIDRLTKSGSKLIDLTIDERQWLNNHPVIRFTGDPNWLPYEAFDKHGKYIGIVAEYLKIIEQSLGIKFEIIPTRSWAESVSKVKKGEIDVLSETSDSDLNSLLNFTQDYVSSPIVIVMKNNEDYVENIKQIQNKKIALIKDYGYLPKIIAEYPEIDFERVKSIQDGLTSVSTGKVEVLLATLAQASYHISELGINNVRIVGKTEFTTRLAFGMREQFTPLIPMFNKVLNNISQNQSQGIYKLWGKHKYIEKINYQLLIFIAIIFVIIISIIVYWNRKLAKEMALRKIAEDQTQTIIDNIPLQVIVSTFDGRILSANSQVLTDYKVLKEEIKQFKIQDFYNNSDDRQQILNELTLNGKVEQKIIQFKKMDSVIRSMMVSVLPIHFDKSKALLTIAVDLTERLDAEMALNQAKQEAELANRAKSEFLANMSHEIRTPMNAIIGFTELLIEQVEEPRLKSFVKTIQSASNNLLSLINDILDLSKVEAGKLKIEKTACNPHELFTEIGNIFTIKMREKNIDFILNIDSNIPNSLQLDAIRLRQVLFNLIGNAVKFTEQGFIRVTARTDNEDQIRSKLDLLIHIEDSGIGISEDQQQLIFQDFVQSTGQDAKKYGGTGLGLSISTRLVNMMGGELSLKSQTGQGSIFTIKLASVDIAAVQAEAIHLEKNNLSISFLPSRILVVDDVADNRSLLQANFTKTKLQVIEAENGQIAVNLARQQIFDLILMDIRMPVMDGYQAAKEIKSFSDVPIVALTASVMTDEFERIKSNKFDGYLRKPVLKKTLFHELCRFLPFEENENEQITEPECLLTKSELDVLDVVLEQLNQLQEQYESVSKANNITDIKLFVFNVMKIVNHHPIKMLNVFVKEISQHLDSFDIAGIKYCLFQYPNIIKQLEASRSLRSI